MALTPENTNLSEEQMAEVVITSVLAAILTIGDRGLSANYYVRKAHEFFEESVKIVKNGE